MDVQPARLMRFGDFELDVRAGELRKHGVRIRLQDQSFQILLMLLERTGQVVLREEIRQKLWPNNTIVEFDHSINAAIKRLRNGDGEPRVPRVRDRRQWMWWSMGAAAILGLAVVALWRLTEKPPAPVASVHFQLPVPEGASYGTLLNLSPDGQKLAFIAAGRLWVHSFATGESRNLTDARGTPFWSPESRFIAYAIPG